MINYDILSLVIGINALTYLIIHIPLDILTLAGKVQREKNNTKIWLGQIMYGRYA